MKETLVPLGKFKPYIAHEPLIQVTLPNKSIKATRAWKIEKKSNYSVPFRVKTFEELRNEHPEGKLYENKFVVDNGKVRRIFNERGHEVERLYYEKEIAIPADNPGISEFEKREISKYDEEGYLVQFSQVRREELGFTRSIEYGTEKNIVGIKVPTRTITQELPFGGKRLIASWPIIWRPSVIMDFTDVPYIPPTKVPTNQET